MERIKIILLSVVKVDTIFRDRSIGNHVKVETIKVMSLDGATFGYIRHSQSSKVGEEKSNGINICCYVLITSLRYPHLRC